ncbi:hypothetical protein ES703_31935 [subsurface metagenome]
MNIYLVKRTDPEGLNRPVSVWIGYDEYDSHVIRAETPEHAREIAKQRWVMKDQKHGMHRM